MRRSGCRRPPRPTPSSDRSSERRRRGEGVWQPIGLARGSCDASRLERIDLGLGAAGKEGSVNKRQGPPMKTYVGYIWIDDEPGIRLSLGLQTKPVPATRRPVTTRRPGAHCHANRVLGSCATSLLRLRRHLQRSTQLTGTWPWPSHHTGPLRAAASRVKLLSWLSLVSTTGEASSRCQQASWRVRSPDRIRPQVGDRGPGVGDHHLALHGLARVLACRRTAGAEARRRGRHHRGERLGLGWGSAVRRRCRLEAGCSARPSPSPPSQGARLPSRVRRHHPTPARSAVRDSGNAARTRPVQERTWGTPLPDAMP